MSVGINYMREHMPDEARIHYAIIDGGGISPNVVQAHAVVRYVVRAATLPDMLKLLERVRKVAAGRICINGWATGAKPARCRKAPYPRSRQWDRGIPQGTVRD